MLSDYCDSKIILFKRVLNRKNNAYIFKIICDAKPVIQNLRRNTALSHYAGGITVGMLCARNFILTVRKYIIQNNLRKNFRALSACRYLIGKHIIRHAVPDFSAALVFQSEISVPQIGVQYCVLVFRRLLIESEIVFGGFRGHPRLNRQLSPAYRGG